MRGLIACVLALLGDRRGGVAILLALSLIPLSLAGIGAIDMHRVVSAKTRLQDALDAAALTAARDSVRDPTKLQEIGKRAFDQNVFDAPLAIVSGPTFRLNERRVVIADASARVSGTVLVDFFTGAQDPVVSARTEVNSSGANVEVSLVVDLTASMEQPAGDGGRRIDALKVAGAGLVDIVVQDHQTPFYSKMAIVPYSAALNVGEYANAVRGPVTAGDCTYPGCASFRFTAANGQPQVLPISTCATERTGTHAYTDAAPTTAYLGRHYQPSGNRCITDTISPLSTDKAYLKGRIAGFTTAGSTAGHIGLAWGWYMISPTFMGGWPQASSRPAPYGTDKLLKFVVLMSDGAFNTVYCKGVVAQNSTAGSGGADSKINCSSENGLPYVQAMNLCNAIKARGVIIYTVLFDELDPSAVNFMRSCATDQARVYLPSSSVQLKDAFASIGADITRLRLSR